MVRHMGVTLSHLYLSCLLFDEQCEYNSCFGMWCSQCSSFGLFFFSCTDAVISFIPFSSRRKTQQFLHMQSKGSSFRPSARDGGLLDPMKTLKSPKPKPPVLRETPTAPHNPPVDTLPNPTRFPLPPSHATAVTRITV